jgi:hypothetical protein
VRQLAGREGVEYKIFLVLHVHRGRYRCALVKDTLVVGFIHEQILWERLQRGLELFAVIFTNNQRRIHRGRLRAAERLVIG